MGLLQSRLDPCIYYKIVNNENMVFLAVYVDDLILFSNNQDSKQEIQE